MDQVGTSGSIPSAVLADPQRLAFLDATGLLDSPPEEHFDRLTRLACGALHAPIALISLADDQRQFLKSALGLPDPLASLRQLPLAASLCERIVATGMAIVITDAQQDAINNANREIEDLNILAYLGVPLTTSDGHTLGSFCVADFKPRAWSINDLAALNDLAATAIREIALSQIAKVFDAGKRDPARQERCGNAARYTVEEQLRRLLSLMGAGVWEFDRISGRLYWSSEMYDLLDCDVAAGPLGPGEFHRIVHPDDRSRVQPMMHAPAASEGGLNFDTEFRVLRRDGKTTWVSALGYAEQDPSGRVVRDMGILRDITARKLAEQAREEGAQFVRKMAAITPDMFYVFDVNERRVVYANRTLDETLGYAAVPERDVPELADHVMHPDDRERARAFRRAVLESVDNTAAEFECRYRRANGEWGWFLVRNTAFARNADGTVQQIVGTTTEITAVKQTENELRRLNAELEQRVAARTADLSLANRELETFAYSVSHDLRAPLRAINGFTQILMQHSRHSLDTEGLNYLGRVHAATLRMGELIDALLSLSRAASGQLSFDNVNMSVLTRTIVTELERAEPDRNVEFVIAPEITATGDPVLLRIALQNLLGNAWKFTSPIKRARIEFGMRIEHDEPQFFIRDNGVGFEMGHATRLFTPFQRLHTTDEFPGTGIGLATVQRIIARHKGQIWADSAPGHGATFYFTLPNGGK